mmetsp:Transcript_689/g.1754  ORF Transcript_689/g.1754 Transcript_689/m.1754 type:complete len:316 (-) Transcript_689:1492-2439(-)
MRSTTMSLSEAMARRHRRSCAAESKTMLCLDTSTSRLTSPLWLLRSFSMARLAFLSLPHLTHERLASSWAMCSHCISTDRPSGMPTANMPSDWSAQCCTLARSLESMPTACVKSWSRLLTGRLGSTVPGRVRALEARPWPPPTLSKGVRRSILEYPEEAGPNESSRLRGLRGLPDAGVPRDPPESMWLREGWSDRLLPCGVTVRGLALACAGDPRKEPRGPSGSSWGASWCVSSSSAMQKKASKKGQKMPCTTLPDSWQNEGARHPRLAACPTALLRLSCRGGAMLWSVRMTSERSSVRASTSAGLRQISSHTSS